MDLFREIEGVFRKLDHHLTDPEVACAAVKQLVRAHLRRHVSPSELAAFDDYLDGIFHRDHPFSFHRAAMLKDIQARLDGLTPAGGKPRFSVVEWI